MLDKFKKIFAGQPAQPASAEQPKEDVTMTTPEKQVDMTADDNTAELTAQLASQSEALVEANAKLAAAVAEHVSLQANLAAMKEANASLVADAASKKLATRKEQLELTVGTAKAESLLASLESLDDAAFNTVVSAMAATFKAEEQTQMFQETGVAAEVVKPVETDTVKKLADTFANQFNLKEGNK